MRLLKISSRVLLASAFSIAWSACSSAPIAPLNSQQGYQDAFRKTKEYLAKCSPNAKVRANLYTDVPEAELIVDHLDPAMVYVIGSSVMMTSERAKETVNLHFYGKGKTTQIVSKTELSREIADNALAGKACPKHLE